MFILSNKNIYLTFLAIIIFVSDKLKDRDVLSKIKLVIKLPKRLKNEDNLLKL